MPMYEYRCEQHGTFEALRAIEQRAAPLRCPSCKAKSKRVLSAPRLRGMERGALIAHERNERSRHEPRISHGHAHAHPHEKRPAAKARDRPALQASSGKRPWVLEHG